MLAGPVGCRLAGTLAVRSRLYSTQQKEKSTVNKAVGTCRRRKGSGGRLSSCSLVEVGALSKKKKESVVGLVIAPAKDEDFVLWLWRTQMAAGGDFLLVVIAHTCGV